MTWGEFQRKMTEAGVIASDEINFIDVQTPLDGLDVSRDRDGHIGVLPQMSNKEGNEADTSRLGL